MTGISGRAIAAAKAVLAKCAANDPWFPQPSESTVLAWAEHIALANLDADILLEAVTVAYGGHTNGFKPLPGDIITAARQIRHDRFQRQPLEVIKANTERIDERLAPFIIELAEAKSIATALKYRRPERNPLRVACPHCRASAGRPCTTGVNRVPLRREPRFHPSRLDAVARLHPPHADRICMCGREIFDAADTCDRCAPVIDRREHPHRNNGTA